MCSAWTVAGSGGIFPSLGMKMDGRRRSEEAIDTAYYGDRPYSASEQAVTLNEGYISNHRDFVTFPTKLPN